MALKKVTDSDLLSKGVTYLADRPRLGSTATLKRKFEEIVRDVIIPYFNQNVDTQEPINAEVNASFQLSNEAIGLSISAEDTARRALEASSGGNQIVQNPFRGVKTSVQTAILDQFFAWSPAPISPEEFDAKGILPETFDGMSIDPFDFDTNAKNIV